MQPHKTGWGAVYTFILASTKLHEVKKYVELGSIYSVAQNSTQTFVPVLWAPLYRKAMKMKVLAGGLHSVQSVWGRKRGSQGW
jgi:hypothetical protein